ncbi:hypothetical protein NKR74_04710 [Bacillus sp. 3103sda1]|uniref:RNase A-like domain-containing protein n=1 Tax=unclassified Bacillus (in: firmicutes) TaxID=185979 RepID=UPI00209FBAEB|nr:RNase A-like domain-containing protein [Bacillus sp. 3103sda1]MCP1122650.1 hypothetical protein [Bacillus sp. 3103sda1]
MGDKGTSKVSTLVKGTNFTKVTEITAPRLQQTFTSLVDDLNIENRLAFADTNGLNLRSSLDSAVFETEEKLSTYQFTKGGDTNAVKPGDSSPLAPGGGLNAHKARGGHLIERHVEKTDAELLQRLQRDLRIPAASTFTDRATAERVANEVLSNPQNITKINRWLNNTNSRPTLPLRYKGEDIIGRYIERGSDIALDVENARIVLKKDNQGSFIITGYPEK